MSARRILFVTGEYPPMQGGVADYTRTLALALAELGHDVAVFTSRQALPAREGDRIPLYTADRGWGWRMWSGLDAVVRAWQPDVVHIQYQTAAFGMHPAVNLWPWRPWHRPPCHTAVTFHDLLFPYLFPKAHPVRRWVTYTLARSCTLAITTNPEDTLKLRRHRSDVVEIPIGSNIPCAPPPDFDRVAHRRRLGLPPDAAVIAYFGFLNASKGGETLVDVLAAVRARGYDAYLLMIGGRVGASDPTNYHYLQQVERRIDRLGLRDYVLWTGHVPADQVSAAFLCADLCLLPYRDGASYRRGSFMAALEHGMAIVTTTPRVPYPDLEDVVLAAPAGEVSALTTAVVRLIQDPAIRRTMGERARRLAAQFGWDSIARRYLAAYADFVC
ncbi:MAG: glycosyltransferase family 1 protein [Caldilineae bacterium]|nr:MAG: glycosyltransferase family 1 protein [Caldilineae bacterium]